MSGRWHWGIAAGAAAAVLVTGTVVASLPQDDLAIVKRAVAQGPASPAPPRVSPEAKDRTPEEGRPPKARGSKPSWLRIRILEDGGKRVSINLPLSVVRALDDLPLDWRCRRDRGRAEGDERCGIRLGDVLEALDQGQDLVEIEEEGKKVRIWVE